MRKCVKHPALLDRKKLVRKLEKTAIRSVFAKGKLQNSDTICTTFSSVSCPPHATLAVGSKTKSDGFRLQRANHRLALRFRRHA